MITFTELFFCQVFSIIVVAVVWDRISLCSPGTHLSRLTCPGIQRSACLCLPSAGIKGQRHHCLAPLGFSKGILKNLLAWGNCPEELLSICLSINGNHKASCSFEIWTFTLHPHLLDHDFVILFRGAGYWTPVLVLARQTLLLNCVPPTLFH